VRQFLANFRRPLLLLLAVVSFAVAGCSTVDKEPDNSSARPWNQPQGWEGGMPGGNMYR
jgi:outer membrane biogenesis lipoprotein LolB